MAPDSGAKVTCGGGPCGLSRKPGFLRRVPEDRLCAKPFNGHMQVHDNPDFDREVLLPLWHAGGASNGQFLIGVLSTGIYCLPSCSARKPKDENVRFLADEAEAQAAGLRACKRCKPQNFYLDYDPDAELLGRLVECINRFPELFDGTRDLCKDPSSGSRTGTPYAVSSFVWTRILASSTTLPRSIRSVCRNCRLPCANCARLPASAERP